jgi:hypothetical protein
MVRYDWVVSVVLNGSVSHGDYIVRATEVQARRRALALALWLAP